MVLGQIAEPRVEAANRSESSLDKALAVRTWQPVVDRSADERGDRLARRGRSGPQRA